MSKAILRLLILFVVASHCIYADEFRFSREIVLKKDEQTKILVKYAKNSKLFKFRWTLYVNKGLVVLKSYDQIVSQNILYLRHENQSVRIDLMPKGARDYRVPYFILKFKEFDYTTNSAKFDLLLSDEEMQVSLDFLK